MLQQHDRHTTEELSRRHHETLEQLPELPEGVVIPDDLSGLEDHRPARRAVRWLRWAVVLVLAAGAAMLVVLLRGDTTEQADEGLDPISQQAIEDQTRAYYADLAAGQAIAAVHQTQQTIDDAVALRSVEDQARAYYADLAGIDLTEVNQQTIDDQIRAYYADLAEAMS